jgi:ATP-dependent DNA helicase PIF1
MRPLRQNEDYMNDETIQYDQEIDVESQFIEGVETKISTSFITGPAGSGKTYLLKQRIKDNPGHAVLASTTGISAVNLGTTTVNSLLKFYDTDSLSDAYVNGWLTRRLIELSDDFDHIAIDEISMMDKVQLDLLNLAAVQSTERGHPIGIIATGDFCQLPPVKAEWAFKADAWPNFAANIERLTKIWRQDNPEFLAALNYARGGEAEKAAEALRPLAKWSVAIDNNFEGTTVMAKNDKVDSYNLLRYVQLQGTEKMYLSSRWGSPLGEWKLIPQGLKLKEKALVMILTNDTEHMQYANGDTGHILSMDDKTVDIKLARNGRTVTVPFLTREHLRKDNPTTEQWKAGAKYDEIRRRYIVGAVTYMPLRLAYATTVHKSQGLTLDNVQLDIRDHFFGAYNMAYVALSRSRTPQGLRIIGSPELLKSRINVHPEVMPWI